MSNAASQIRACIVDEDSYRKNRKLIIEQIKNGEKVYSETLVEVVKSALGDNKESDVSKFISLYFLKDAMDTKDNDLVRIVHDKLIESLGEYAKNDTKKIFSSQVDMKIIRNFDQLLLECIQHWAEWFGSEKNWSKYNSIFEEVEQVVEMPKKNAFFRKPALIQAKGKGESVAAKPAESKTKEKKEDILKKLQNLLERLPEVRERLIESVFADDKPHPDQEALKLVEDEFKTLDKEMKASMNLLFNMGVPEEEELVNDVLKAIIYTSGFLAHYSSLERKQITTDDFKFSIIDGKFSAKNEARPDNIGESALPKPLELAIEFPKRKKEFISSVQESVVSQVLGFKLEEKDQEKLANLLDRELDKYEEKRQLDLIKNKEAKKLIVEEEVQVIQDKVLNLDKKEYEGDWDKQKELIIAQEKLKNKQRKLNKIVQRIDELRNEYKEEEVKQNYEKVEAELNNLEEATREGAIEAKESKEKVIEEESKFEVKKQERIRTTDAERESQKEFKIQEKREQVRGELVAARQKAKSLKQKVHLVQEALEGSVKEVKSKFKLLCNDDVIMAEVERELKDQDNVVSS